MEGVGAVFELYRDGILEDDDEVAVAHGPAETGFVSASEAMVISGKLCEKRSDSVLFQQSCA